MEIYTQTDNHKLRQNVATNKMYILRKMSLKLQNPMFKILCKITLFAEYDYMLQCFKKLKLYVELVLETLQ